uniref:Glutamine-dependent NAD(+) synthetase n=1 Tax=Ditylenchus dipsaci TaxID=166011 RepID=A0A915D1H6_9BILA
MFATRRINVAVCTVNNWALDFTGNSNRILKTCREAYAKGARIRLGPELEIPSYGCEDHFFEIGTEIHSWKVLRSITEESKKLQDMLIITGMPIRYRGVLYNCMVAVANNRIVFIYPKSVLCNDDIYRESRWFVPWQRKNQVVEFFIPPQFGFEQTSTTFGSGIIESTDCVKIGFEMCEELWTAKSPSAELALQGVDILCNSSGSHHTLGKSCLRINQLVLGTTSKLGGVYLYSNHRGCDGGRVYYDGMSSIAQNEQLYAQINQFDIEETCVATSLLDLQHSTNYRGKITSICQESGHTGDIPTVKMEANLLDQLSPLTTPTSPPISTIQRSNVDELCHGPPAFLWHYLRRSKASGYFLPLSGGQDSSSVALMVRLMCEKVCQAVRDNPDQEDPAYYFQGQKVGTDAAELCSKILFTCYMGSENSSEMTKNAAKMLAKDISSNHTSVLFICAVLLSSDNRETMALQNVQARIRMVLAYLFAQGSLIYYKRAGGLLVLGSSNVDESLVGYVTKYDCSSADINPIGSISKRDLREFLHYVYDNHNFPNLKEVLNAIPTAELRPLTAGEVTQTDEAEIGLTYDELSVMGRLRRPGNCDPYSMFIELLSVWYPEYTYEQVFEKQFAVAIYNSTGPVFEQKGIMSGKYRNEVIQLYRNLYYLGKEYPNGSLWFHERLKKAFAKNMLEKDDEKIKELIGRGEYVVKEIEALYALKKYRALKNRYYSDDQK